MLSLLVGYRPKSVAGQAWKGFAMGMRRRTRRRAVIATAAVVHHHDNKMEAQTQQAPAGYQEEQAPAQPQYEAPPAAPAQPVPPPADPADQIEHLAQLHTSGAITDEEFAAAKAKVLGT
jgi:Short C-terminal domain